MLVGGVPSRNISSPTFYISFLVVALLPRHKVDASSFPWLWFVPSIIIADLLQPFRAFVDTHRRVHPLTPPQDAAKVCSWHLNKDSTSSSAIKTSVCFTQRTMSAYHVLFRPPGTRHGLWHSRLVELCGRRGSERRVTAHGAFGNCLSGIRVPLRHKCYPPLIRLNHFSDGHLPEQRVLPVTVSNYKWWGHMYAACMCWSPFVWIPGQPSLACADQVPEELVQFIGIIQSAYINIIRVICVTLCCCWLMYIHRLSVWHIMFGRLVRRQTGYICWCLVSQFVQFGRLVITIQAPLSVPWSIWQMYPSLASGGTCSASSAHLQRV